MSLPAAPSLASEARRVRGVADRQVARLDDLVAVEVGDRHLGRRDQVQLVPSDDVHLVFLVGDLARARRRRRVHDGGRPDLGEPVLARVDVEEPRDQGSLEGRSGALVDGEARAGDLRAAGIVDDVQRFPDLPMGLARPCGAARGSIRTHLAIDRRVLCQDLAPGAHGDVGVLAADRHVRVGRVGDPQQRLLGGRLDLGEFGVERRDPLTRGDRRRLQVGDLGTGG